MPTGCPCEAVRGAHRWLAACAVGAGASRQRGGELCRPDDPAGGSRGAQGQRCSRQQRSPRQAAPRGAGTTGKAMRTQRGSGPPPAALKTVPLSKRTTIETDSPLVNPRGEGAGWALPSLPHRALLCRLLGAALPCLVLAASGRRQTPLADGPACPRAAAAQHMHVHVLAGDDNSPRSSIDRLLTWCPASAAAGRPARQSGRQTPALEEAVQGA